MSGHVQGRGGGGGLMTPEQRVRIAFANALPHLVVVQAAYESWCGTCGKRAF